MHYCLYWKLRQFSIAENLLRVRCVFRCVLREPLIAQSEGSRRTQRNSTKDTTKNIIMLKKAMAGRAGYFFRKCAFTILYPYCIPI